MAFQFALDLIKYCEALQEDKKFIIALKSGISIAANIRETQNAESKADFVPKFKNFCQRNRKDVVLVGVMPIFKRLPKVDSLMEQLVTILRIVNKIVITSKQK